MASAPIALAVTAAPAHADNPCAVAGTASYYYHPIPNSDRVTVYAQAHIDRNPCGRDYRAYIVCDNGRGTNWRYGPEGRVSGDHPNAWSTTQDCPDGYWGRQKGYQVYAAGQWVTFPQ
ncbi:hypothetical protein ACIBG8_10075 [Nonomuraea sp. NPDC050556]|uniref:hypothetical protein n=1 Tax=Nonomuraea sp. NPDC050556 TaxID=3364369 RepID=UPI0037B1628D